MVLGLLTAIGIAPGVFLIAVEFPSIEDIATFSLYSGQHKSTAVAMRKQAAITITSFSSSRVKVFTDFAGKNVYRVCR